MATIIYDTDYKRNEGPWLLGRKELIDLDEVFAEVARLFGEAALQSREETIQQRVTRLLAMNIKDASESEILAEVEKDAELDPVVVRATFKLQGGKSVSDTTIAGALKHGEISGSYVQELRYSCSFKYTELQLIISTGKHHGLRIDARPSESEVVQSAFGEIKAWVLENRASKPVNMWSRFGAPAASLAVILPVAALAVWQSHDPNATKEAVVEKARSLLADGITQVNMPQAMEYLLRTNLSIYQSTAMDALQSPPLPFVLLWAATAVVLFSAPPTTIGVGGSEFTLRRRRWFIKMVAVALGLVVTALLVPYARRVLFGF